MPSKKSDAATAPSADAAQSDPSALPVRKFLQGGGVHPELPGLFIGPDGRVEVEQQSDGSWRLLLDDSGATASVDELRSAQPTGGPADPEEAAQQPQEPESAPEPPAAPEPLVEPEAAQAPSEPSPEPEAAQEAPEASQDAPASESDEPASESPTE